jgi:hypothetical protein
MSGVGRGPAELVVSHEDAREGCEAVRAARRSGRERAEPLGDRDHEEAGGSCVVERVVVTRLHHSGRGACEREATPGHGERVDADAGIEWCSPSRANSLASIRTSKGRLCAASTHPSR